MGSGGTGIKVEVEVGGLFQPLFLAVAEVMRSSVIDKIFLCASLEIWLLMVALVEGVGGTLLWTNENN